MFAAQGAANACGYDYDEYEDYNSWFFASFDQEWSFFGENKYQSNIEDWSKYLGISTDDAQYLVLKASKADIEAAINGYSGDEKLKFMSADFVKKNRKALQYLVCAKMIEPFATKKYDTYWAWSYYYDEGPSITELGDDYTATLVECCENETDKDLKLRYGYQLVRYAHYMEKYTDAILYFEKYVEPLGIKNEVYYYALSQKAGAEYNIGKYNQAVSNFMTVYLNSKDLKETAYRSIFRFCDGHFTQNSLLQMCKTQEQKNDFYLLLVYNDFVNPLEMAKKITDADPNAPQARTVMTKQIRQLETYFQQQARGQEITITSANEFRISQSDKQYNATIDYLKQMTSKVADTDFWNMCLGFCYFLNADYASAKTALDKVSAQTKSSNGDIANIYKYMEICQLKTITKDTETKFFEEHKDLINNYTAGNYLRKILANRYFVAQDYAKAYLCANEYFVIEEYYPQSLLESLRELVLKKDKTPMEEWLTRFYDNVEKIDLSMMKGAIAVDDAERAATIKNKYNIDDKVDVDFFGHNIENVYGTEYGILKDYVSNLLGSSETVSLTASLNTLKQAANGSDEKAAKANYLLGNLYYNLSHVGCCRHYLRGAESADYYYSDYANYRNTGKIEYTTFDKNKATQKEYFPLINGTYHNTLDIADKYYQKAEELSGDKELKAHAVFGEIKCDQGKNAESDGWWYDMYVSPKFSKLLGEYNDTKYESEVRENCSYYSFFIPDGDPEVEE